MTERFSGGGWTELHQTGGEVSQTIPKGQLCFRISKSCPVPAQRPPTDGLLPKKGLECCFAPPTKKNNAIGDTKLKKIDVLFSEHGRHRAID